MIPNIYWGQSTDYIFVKFDIPNITGLNIDFNNNKLVMSGYSKSIQYKTDYEFYNKIHTDLSLHKYSINESNIECKIKKKINKNWKYLIQNQSFYKNHIKIDWSKWMIIEDDSLFDSQIDTIINNIYNKPISSIKNNKIKETTNLNGLTLFDNYMSDSSDE